MHICYESNSSCNKIKIRLKIYNNWFRYVSQYFIHSLSDSQGNMTSTSILATNLVQNVTNEGPQFNW